MTKVTQRFIRRAGFLLGDRRRRGFATERRVLHAVHRWRDHIWAKPWHIPQRARHRPDAGLAALDVASCPRFGFTVTRKIGNAVVRNRIRRRFKEALRLLAPGIIAPGHDYVVIARPDHFGKLSDPALVGQM